MLKRERIKSRLELENEEKSEILQNFVILLSDDDDEDEEANKDLTLEIVERAKRREANKRKREEGFNEVKVSSSSSDGPDGDVFRSSGVIDVASSSSDEIIGLDRIAGDLIVPEVKKKKKKARRSRKKKTDSEANIVDNVVEEPVKTVTPVEAEAIGVIETEAIGVVKTEELVDPVKGVEISETKAVEISDNIVLRKLLRGPRYFDPPNRSFSTCYNCGEEGHLAVNCSSKKRKKPCFICGSFEHGVRNCTQGQDCFICKRSGHRAKHCPEKCQVVSQNSIICIKCGGSGHTMVSCMKDYAPEDLKEIQCYICKEFGHLCCVNSIAIGPGDVSCYNCGQSGHTGLGCVKQRGETSGACTNTLCCYKCGEEGHFARGCTKYYKPEHKVGEFSTPTKFPKESKDSFVFRSASDNLDRANKKKNAKYERGKFGSGEKLMRSTRRDFMSPERPKKNTQHDRRDSVSVEKHKCRGGWITDDTGDLPNYWRSPSTSTNGWRLSAAKNTNGWRLPITNNANGWRSPATPTNTDHRTPLVHHGAHYPNFETPWRQSYHPPGTPNSYGSANHYLKGFSASRFGNSNSGGEFNRNYRW